jgi:hypothetical protein
MTKVAMLRCIGMFTSVGNTFVKNCMDPISLLSVCESRFHQLACILLLVVLKETFT